MRRIVILLCLLVTALIAEGVGSLFRHAMPADADTGYGTANESATAQPAIGEEFTVFCQSVVMFTLPEKRWMAYVKHPDGGREALEESVRLLAQDGMPNPLPAGNLFDHYEVLDTACFSWDEIFEVADMLYLGRARSSLEEPDAPVTIYDKRRALMKLFFKDQWELAESLFPLRGK